MKWSAILLAGVAGAGIAFISFAEEPPASSEASEAREAQIRELAAGLHFQAGEIPIGDNLATLKLPENLRYLSPQDTRTVLVGLWGNPPDSEGTLGMIVPKGVDFFSESSWAVEITYVEDGHVKDSDADKIDYDALLEDMKKSADEANPERIKEGYPSIQLIGWAAAPKYDREGKKLYWAKELEFGDSPEHTLNYNIRILGRKGVLVLNAIAASKDLPVIEAATPELLAAVSFNPGNRYADFDASTDKVAAYGLAALVAGGVAAKLGFFKVLWVGILAFKKLILAGIVAAAAFAKRFFGRHTA